MPLPEDIKIEVASGRLQQLWTTADLLANENLSKKYTVNNLRSRPANCSASLAGLDLGTGANVTGTNTPFVRVGRRIRAILYALRDDSGNQGDKDLIAARSPASASGSDDASDDAIEEADTPVQEHAARGATYVLGDVAHQVLCALVQQMQQEQPWNERLITYRWNRRTFVETKRDLAEIIRQGRVLSHLITHEVPWDKDQEAQAVAWAESIFKWGGTRQRNPVTWEKVHCTLSNAVRNQIVYPDAPMNSGYTKVASFGTAYLEEAEHAGIPQVINDSRVATSLTCRLEKILQARDLTPVEVFPGLGKVEAARGGTRPRTLALAWPNAYQRWSGQFAATALVLAIRDILNQDSKFPSMPDEENQSPWTVRGVEAVLFMDGY